MLSREDNELICRVGPNTAMGNAMRRFWIPAMLSSELPQAGRDPLHVELLGESFVGFRNERGEIGLLDEACCHRGASLTVGRVENCGIRCIYHGWLFSPTGKVLETPNVTDPRFKERVKARAYPVREAGGLIWTYLGDPAQLPPFPDFAFNDAPADMRLSALAVFNCNYVQILEGLLDSSHLSVLHSSTLTIAAKSNLTIGKAIDHMQFDSAPRIEGEETEFGLHYAAVRMVKGKAETRVTGFLSPFWIFNPNGDIIVAIVPMSDTKTAFFHVWWDGKTAFGSPPQALENMKVLGLDPELSAKYGHSRQTAGGPDSMCRQNNWRQDRLAMHNGHFTGMPSFTQEDMVVTLSSGGIRDRSKECLATSDLPIALLYRVLLKSANNVKNGKEPVALGQSVRDIRGVHAALESGDSWRALVPKHRTLRATAVAS